MWAVMLGLEPLAVSIFVFLSLMIVGEMKRRPEGCAEGSAVKVIWETEWIHRLGKNPPDRLDHHLRHPWEGYPGSVT